MIQGVNFPDLLVTFVQLINHCSLHQVVSKDLAVILIGVAGFPSVVADIEIASAPLWELDWIAFTVCVISSVSSRFLPFATVVSCVPLSMARIDGKG